METYEKACVYHQKVFCYCYKERNYNLVLFKTIFLKSVLLKMSYKCKKNITEIYADFICECYWEDLFSMRCWSTVGCSRLPYAVSHTCVCVNDGPLAASLRFVSSLINDPPPASRPPPGRAPPSRAEELLITLQDCKHTLAALHAY